jgi:hypothetical protein
MPDAGIVVAGIIVQVGLLEPPAPLLEFLLLAGLPVEAELQ